MSQGTLEERVEHLEQQVAQLLAGSQTGDVKKDWRKTIGMFSGDPAMKEIQEEGRKIREADQEQAKRDHP
jgi:phage shock protein A